MDWNMNDVVDAGLEQFDRIPELLQVVEGNDRCMRLVADALGNARSVRTVSQDKRPDCHYVVADGRLQPFAKISRRETDRDDAFAIESSCIAPCNGLPIIDDDEHVDAPVCPRWLL